MSQAVPPTDAKTVLAEIQAGDGLTLSAVGKQFPAHRGGGTVSPSAVWRWVNTGARSSSGERVRLEAVRVGGRWLSSQSAVTRFIEALTARG